MKLIDRWTTRDGEWYVSDKQYSIDQAHINNYGAEASQLGGANHIYVKAPPGSTVSFYTPGAGGTQENLAEYTAQVSGWVNHPMFHSSAFNPTEVVGVWVVEVNGEIIVAGIGLPYGWHVSTFLVVGEGEPVVLPSPPTQGGDRVQFIVNGAVLYDSEAR